MKTTLFTVLEMHIFPIIFIIFGQDFHAV